MTSGHSNARNADPFALPDLVRRLTVIPIVQPVARSPDTFPDAITFPERLSLRLVGTACLTA